MNFKYDRVLCVARNEDQTVAVGINKEIRGERGPGQTIGSYSEPDIRFTFVIYPIFGDTEPKKPVAYIVPLRSLRLSILTANTTDKTRREWHLNNIERIKKIMAEGLSVCAIEYNRLDPKHAPFPVYYVESFDYERDYESAKVAVLKGEY